MPEIVSIFRFFQTISPPESSTFPFTTGFASVPVASMPPLTVPRMDLAAGTKFASRATSTRGMSKRAKNSSFMNSPGLSSHSCNRSGIDAFMRRAGNSSVVARPSSVSRRSRPFASITHAKAGAFGLSFGRKPSSASLPSTRGSDTGPSMRIETFPAAFASSFAAPACHFDNSAASSRADSKSTAIFL